jgi:outer membrane protein OmpA-like peptidoglycan-associated protein
VILLVALAAAEPASPTGGLYAGYLWTPEENPLEGGPILVGRLGIAIVPVFDVEIEAGRMESKTRDLGIVYQAYSPRASFLFHATPRKRFDLFLAVGAGAQLTEVLRDSEADQSNESDRALYRNPSQDVVVNAGPGLTMQVAGPLHIRTDLRWYGTFGQDAQRAQDDVFQDIEWTLGLDFRAEAPPDRDGDGIKNKDDACPDEPEDFDDFEDEDGCPDDDNDGDGIPDTRDECPDKKEDRDGFQDTDGCPDPDNDNDGIKDKVDACPDEPEDEDGFADDDGCPDPDNDGDGIIDSRDGCPDEPETDNNYQDTDGCPDEVPDEVRAFTGVIEGITFETNRDVIRETSLPTLEAALKVLLQFKDTKIMVEGHTDDVGDDTYNLDLSERRAAAVVRWFLAHGMAEERMQFIGYGETRPRAENTTDAGRAENRRVEFTLVE